MTYDDMKKVHPILRQQFGKDPCPVCMTMHDRPNTNFCSVKCTALANSFRRRVRNAMVKLSILDFHLEFIDGVFPKLHIPPYLNRFYPMGENSFFLSRPGLLDVQHAVLGDFWEVIQWEMGMHIYQFIVEQNMRPNSDVHELRKLFEQWAALGLQTDETHFICRTCNNLYLKGGLTCYYEESQCSRCQIASIPF